MRLSLRFWQTALFIFVVVVAMGVIWLNLFSALQKTASRIAAAKLQQRSFELSHHVARDLAVYPTKEKFISHFTKFGEFYQDDFWVFDENGNVLVSRNKGAKLGSLMISAKRQILAGGRYAQMVTERDFSVAGDPVYINERMAGAVLVSTPLTDVRNVVDIARQEVTIAFLSALVISALLAGLFASIISRQVKRLSRGALAMAQGNFDLRIEGMFPTEVRELAESLSLMAGKLGRAFGSIERQRNELSTVISFMTDGVLEVSENGLIKLVNPVASELLGSPLGLEGRQIDELQEAGPVAASAAAALDGGEFAQVWESGARSLLVQSTPIRENARVTGCIVVLRDVTEQKRLELAQREFVANASHELRTPIASLKGFVELLQNGADKKPEVRIGFLEQMGRQVSRLQKLIDQLFTLAQFDSGRISLKLERNQVREIVDDVLSTCGALTVMSGIELGTDVAGSLPDVVCDKDRVVQVLTGFVDNAVKHCPRGSRAVVLAVREGKTGVRMGITDNGPGIPHEVVASIFHRFYRLPGDRPRAEGAGLGLSIAKEIIEAHKSRVEVESSQGRGTTFSFVLPIARAARHSGPGGRVLTEA